LIRRETEVLQCAGGHRNRDIGEHFRICEETLKVHLRHIREKPGARDRTQAVTIAMRRRMIQLSGRL
jgi:two-component system NarL family response regulator